MNIQGPTRLVSATPLRVIKNIIRVAQRGPLPPLSPPTHEDITTDEQLCDLIMSSMSSYDDQNMRHFGLTPIDEIPLG